MADMIITIDGPAGSGKSTAARRLAEKLNAAYLDTGAMYRAVTLAAMQANVDMQNEAELLAVLENSDFLFGTEQDKWKVSINGLDVTEQIRRPDVTANAKYIASCPELREKLVQMQRKFAENRKKIVTEGRDQATVAFKNANFKFYLTADTAERAKRRFKELSESTTDTTLEETRKNIEKRDLSDQNRTVGPLKPAGDAIIIDTTGLTVEEVVGKMLHYVEKKR